MKQSKIAIVGAGVVGSTTAYALMMKNIVSKLILVDVKETKCKGEVYDLRDALSFSNTAEIVTGSLQDAGQSDIVIITSGIAQKPGQSRMDLLNTNREVIQNVIDGMKPLNQDLVIIMVTNPVDILTYVAQQISGLPKDQVFGSGTFLDTQRLRSLMSEKIKVAPQSIHLYVLGEHGDSQFVTWSTGHIADTPLLDFPGLDKAALEQMANAAKKRAYEIIECKGSTAFGISACIAAYCHDIISQQKRVVPVSCYVKEYDICLSMPVVLGKKGIDTMVMPVFNDEERVKLKQSVATLKEYIKELQF